jgi:hypothetical protein
MIMRFRPANIRLINRRQNLPRLLLALSSAKETNNDKSYPTNLQHLTWSLHISELGTHGAAGLSNLAAEFGEDNFTPVVSGGHPTIRKQE